MGITIKGKAGGVFEIEIQPLSSFLSIKKDISEKLSGNMAFFSGADAKLVVSGKTLTKAQKQGSAPPAPDGLRYFKRVV